MNNKTFQKLDKTLRRPLKITKLKTKVITYGAYQRILKIEGKVKVLVETNKKKVTLTNHKT